MAEATRSKAGINDPGYNGVDSELLAITLFP